MSACIGEPLSWLRLERYQLNELAEPERVRVAQHLASCELCSACFARTETPASMPALRNVRSVRSGVRRSAARWRWTAALATAALAIVGSLLVVRPAKITDRRALTPAKAPRLQVKGGELALELVREHLGSIADDNTLFAAGDRWKALLTCPPGMRPLVELVVFQAGQVFFPLQATRVEQCGNRVALPGAFVLDGVAPITVCLIAGEGLNAADRSALERRGVAALPALSVCQPLRPIATKPAPL